MVFKIALIIFLVTAGIFFLAGNLIPYLNVVVGFSAIIAGIAYAVEGRTNP